jgi:hypothetical protein
LNVELLVGEILPAIDFHWSTNSLHLRYEKQMGQWTVPANIADYQQTTREFEFPLNALKFCDIEPSMDVPILRGPEHLILKKEDVVILGDQFQHLLKLQDSSGDDGGENGNYVYPKNPQFQPGIVDILSFEVSENDESYAFDFTFANLVDPGWHPEYGYQLTYCVLGISHNNKTGISDVGKNAHSEFKAAFKADEILYISGSIQLCGADGEIRAEYMPVEPSGAIGDDQTDHVRFKLPKEMIHGDLSKSRFQIAVGFQDDHGGAGLGDFRSVEITASEWSGGGRTNPGESNIYDWLIQ